MVDDEQVRRITQAAEKLAAITPQNKVSSEVNLNLNHVGTQLLPYAFVASVVMNMCLAVAFLDHGRKIDEINKKMDVMKETHDRKIDEVREYLAAIYMIAPQLKPKEK